MASGPHTPAGASAASQARTARAERRSAPQRRRRRRRRREPRSDLSGRILAAIPAIAVALFLVIEGGAVFALGLLVLGAVCMHELYGMYERAHPARLAGLIALAGLLAAALYGDQFQVLLVAVAALPLVFALTLASPRPSVGGLALTLLGIYWIGFALAHAVTAARASRTGKRS